MIDTIRLEFDVKKFPEEFRFSKSKSGVFKGVINPTKAQKNSGKYYPRITFIKRPQRGGFQQRCQVEFSVPKLLKGNNFSEVCDTDFDGIVDALRHAMGEMGVKFQFSEVVKKYKVTKIDYSKNIIFTDGTTVAQILRLLNTANIKRTMDVSEGEFRNGGQIYHLHTNHRDIVFYDKIADLKHAKISPKRTTNPEDNHKCQLSFLDFFEKHKNLAVLRFEIRLNGAKEIKANLAQIGQNPDDLTFKRLFSSDIPRAILLNWWDKIFATIPKAPLDNETIENVFLGLLRNEDATPQRVLATIGAYCLARSPTYDARFAREIFDKRFANGSWARSQKLLLTPEAPKNLRHLLHIENTIREMRPVNIEEYQMNF